MIRVDAVKSSTGPEPETPCLAMRPRDAAKALGVSERFLWDWTKRGDVPHIRRGKKIIYPVDSLREWLKRQAQAAEKEGEKNSQNSA